MNCAHLYMQTELEAAGGHPSRHVPRDRAAGPHLGESDDQQHAVPHPDGLSALHRQHEARFDVRTYMNVMQTYIYSCTHENYPYYTGLLVSVPVSSHV